MRLVTALLLLALAGCVGGPSYAGGPTTEEPHAVVDPSTDITLWRVDGHDVETRSGKTYVAPGTRRLSIRIEHPIESDAWEPKEEVVLPLRAEAGKYYLLERKPGLRPPYQVRVRQFRLDDD
jgi:hypothetical protein